MSLLACCWSCGAPTGGAELGACLDVTAPAGTRVLVFSRTAGYRHESIGAGVDAIRALGARHGFTVAHTESPAFFTPDSLSRLDRKSTRLNSSHSQISYAVFCL